MIRKGDTIENPVTGERITFLSTSADTDGEAVVIETVVKPDGFVRRARAPFQRSGSSSRGSGHETCERADAREPGRRRHRGSGTAHRFE